MRISRLATMFTIAALALTGCGGTDSTTPEPTPQPTPQSEPFALNGAWVYLGPSDAPHTLTVGPGSMVYTDLAGNWSSNWTIKTYDNGLHNFQVVFGSGSGAYLPVGDNMSGTYELSGTLLTVQLAKGLAAYPPLQGAGSCTSATDGMPLPECRLYIKQP